MAVLKEALTLAMLTRNVPGVRPLSGFHHATAMNVDRDCGGTCNPLPRAKKGTTHGMGDRDGGCSQRGNIGTGWKSRPVWLGPGCYHKPWLRARGVQQMDAA